MKNHMEGKSFNCKFCSMTFNAKPDLMEHLKSHSNEKPFLCSECGQRYLFINSFLYVCVIFVYKQLYLKILC